MEVTLSELCILTMHFSGNVGHLEETKVKSLLDRVSPLGSCDFQTQMWLMARRQSCFSYKGDLGLKQNLSVTHALQTQLLGGGGGWKWGAC